MIFEQYFLYFLFSEAKRMRKEVERDIGSQGDEGSKPSTPRSGDHHPSSPSDHGNHGDGPHSDSCSSVGAPLSPKDHTGSSGTHSPAETGESRSHRSSSSPITPRGLAGFSAMAAMMDSESGTGGARRAPIDMLCRIFPHMKRGVLQLILQGCSGDVVQAIEQVLNNHSSEHSTASTGSGSLGSPTEGMGGLTTPPGGVTHRPYITAPQSAMGSGSGLKSAFSPITSLASAASVAAAAAANPLRYAYPPGAASRLALAMPYPPGFMPNLATLGYAGYASGLANAQKASLPYPLCPSIPSIPCPYPNPADK